MRGRPVLVVSGATLALAATITAGAWLAGRGVEQSAPRVEPEPAPTTFIAFARDFRGFRGWERHAVTGAMMPIGAPEGPTFVYVNRRAPEGARRWPVGTIVVKAIESGSPERWTIHAMVKRGVPFNADGALGWEYFELRFDEGREDPAVVWRGGGPPSGHGYAAAGRASGADAGEIPLVCDDCHAPAWQNDGVLTRALALHP